MLLPQQRSTLPAWSSGAYASPRSIRVVPGSISGQFKPMPVNVSGGTLASSPSTHKIIRSTSRSTPAVPSTYCKVNTQSMGYLSMPAQRLLTPQTYAPLSARTTGHHTPQAYAPVSVRTVNQFNTDGKEVERRIEEVRKPLILEIAMLREHIAALQSSTEEERRVEEARKPLIVEIAMLREQVAALQSATAARSQPEQEVVVSDSDGEFEDQPQLENSESADFSGTTSLRTRRHEANIRAKAKGALTIPSDQPVYVGKATHMTRPMHHGVLYFDAGSTGTRPQIFIYKAGERSLNQFWMLSRSKEIQNIRVHECLEGKYPNEELLERLKTASDQEKLDLVEDVRLSDAFVDYVKNTIHQCCKIVNRWMVKEREEKGVIFWSDDSAVLFTNILIGITGGLRAIVGQSAELLERINVRLTSYLTEKLNDAHILNDVNLTVEQLTGELEAQCEASAVSVLSRMDAQTAEPGAVVSLGGATVQMSAKQAGITEFVSVPVARKMAIAAGERQLAGDSTAFNAYEAEYNTAQDAVLDRFPGFLQDPRDWNAVSGLYFIAKDNGIELDTRLSVDDVVMRFRAKVPELLQSGASARDVGSVVAAMTVLSHLKGVVTFQRQWLNRTTNQNLNGNVSTGYVLRRLGFTDDK